MSKNPTINEAIQTQINHALNQQLTPLKVYLTKIYTGNKYADCKTLNGDIITYIPLIANNPAVNNIGILFFLENDEKIIITK